MHYVLRGLLPTLLFLSVAGCDFNAAQDVLDEFDIIITLDEIDTVVSASLVDAETGNYVSSRAAVWFMGDDADTVVDMFSDPITGQQVEGGLTSFGIANGVVPSESNPVQLRVVAMANGYSMGVAHIAVRTSGTTDVIIPLYKQNTVLNPGDYGTASQTIASSGGVVQATTTVRTSDTPTVTAASVTIPTGTEARTSDGSPAQGPISANITYFEASPGTGAVPFRAGSVATVEGRNGEPDGSLSLLAASSISLVDQGGNGVDYLSSPVEISMELNDETINPRTGQPFQPGDEIDMFVYDPVTATWRFAGTSTASTGTGKGVNPGTIFQNSIWWFGTPNPNPPPDIQVFEFTPLTALPEFIRPLSGWWTDSSVGFSGCMLGATVRIGPYGTVTTSADGCSMTIGLGDQTPACTVRANLSNNVAGGSVTVKNFSGGTQIADIGPIPFQAGAGSVAIDGLPRTNVSKTATMEFTANGGTVSETITLPTDCGGTKSITLPSPPATVDVTLDLQISSSRATCASGALRVTSVPALVIKYKEQGTSDASSTTVSASPTYTKDARGRITGGSLLVPGLVQGKTYTFSTTINGTREQRDITISGATQTLDISEDVDAADMCAAN